MYIACYIRSYVATHICDHFNVINVHTVPLRGNVALARNIFLVTRMSITQTHYLPSQVYKLLTQKWLYA